MINSGSMDIRNYFSRKRVHGESTDAGGESNDETATTESPPKVTKKKMYKSRLTYRPEWEKKYSWVYCTNPLDGMFCKICQKWGRAPSTARGVWTARGIKDWNHATQSSLNFTLNPSGIKKLF